MNLLCLDFDGVLHPANDAILLNFRANAPAWEIALALKAQRRFIWSPLLESAIADSDVKIIIHSTWRKKFSDASMKQFLPAELSSRVIALDGQIECRETAPSDVYLAEALELLAPTSACVLDDRPEFFLAGGRVANWLSQNHGFFLYCHPELGLTTSAVAQDLRNWSLHHPPAPTQTPAPSAYG